MQTDSNRHKAPAQGLGVVQTEEHVRVLGLAPARYARGASFPSTPHASRVKRVRWWSVYMFEYGVDDGSAWLAWVLLAAEATVNHLGAVYSLPSDPEPKKLKPTSELVTKEPCICALGALSRFLLLSSPPNCAKDRATAYPHLQTLVQKYSAASWIP